MWRGAWVWMSALIVALLTGCAHPISLNTDLGKVIGSGATKVERKVGLAVSDEQRYREVISPGGGGDKLSYRPYRDLETGLYAALSENFTGVVKLRGAADPKVQSEGVNYIVTPTITTTSFSPSIFTWPPTVFTVELSCSVTDAQNKPVTELRVQGDGRAEFDEFKGDFSLSAKRAAEDALQKLVKAFAELAAKLR